MTEMYKTKKELNPSFMKEIFCENAAHHNLRNNNEFLQPKVKSVSNGTESVRFKGPKLLPPTIRNWNHFVIMQSFCSKFGLSIKNNFLDFCFYTAVYF